MMKPWYISIQRVDYDDYPIGTERRVGPFGTVEEAHKFMDDSPYFLNYYSGGLIPCWTFVGQSGQHSVKVKSLNDLQMTAPESFRG